ncbi:hypothetical protein V1J52_23085 [Streptomyces sp. TRM 70351]|uniref:hypothetical protein n=1 Tax=Streptomyces sp. TRM 70351 TaxID=3116552 RepID=UPI002E7C4FAF|nr:hypothetical protein [Streptomyces sp. TRM 70351]MEE1931028.1 hypothetical protein [Streptomyces sp. TRM 70351]
MPRTGHTARPRRALAALCATVLLLAGTAACSAAERLTTALRVKAAVERLGEHREVSVTARLDATQAQAHAYLRHRAGPGADDERLRRQARLLTDLEVAAAVRSGKPLRDLAPSDRLDSATAVSFGGQDVFGVRSVDRRLYVHVSLAALVRDVGPRGPVLRHAPELEQLTEDLPSSLRAAQAALRGYWVHVKPAEFGEFAEVLGGEAGEPAERLARSTSVLTGASVQHRLADAVGGTLREHAGFQDAGRRGGAEHVTVTLPARQAATTLAAALEPLRHHLGDPDLAALERAPDRAVRLDLGIRDGVLASLTVDLGQLDPRAPGALPLRLEFAPGEVTAVAAPRGARSLAPQDLLTALTYATTREPELSSLLHTLRTLEL